MPSSAINCTKSVRNEVTSCAGNAHLSAFRREQFFPGHNSTLSAKKKRGGGEEKKERTQAVIFTLSRNRFEYSKINARIFYIRNSRAVMKYESTGLVASYLEELVANTFPNKTKIL